jgi:pyridoxamine 5'-phosphate oxidase
MTPVSADPIALFLSCRADAVEAGAPMDGMIAVLATASSDGAPSARCVLVKEVGPEGFFVYTNYRSRKGTELDTNPRAALCMHWVETGIQFRIEGRVSRASRERSDAYFASRPRESQLAGWTSDQSQPLASREALLGRFAEIEARFEGRPVDRPEHWGGYRIEPERIEHWQNGAHRLHDRFLYVREGDGWRATRLAP